MTTPNFLEGIEDASANGTEQWPSAGHYYGVIQKLYAGQNDSHVPFVELQVRVIHIMSTEDGIPPNPVHAIVRNRILRTRKSFLGDVKGLVVGIMGCADKDVTSEVVTTLCGDQNPLRGRVVEFRVEAIELKTPKDGRTHWNKFTVMRGGVEREELEGVVPTETLDRYLETEAS